MNRDENLLRIRPQISTEQKDGMTDDEIFQNVSLRPILKLQNDVLVQLFTRTHAFKKSRFNTKDNHQKEDIIDRILSTDHKSKAELVSIIVAHMTSSELSRYCSNEAEYRKRIVSMIITRLKDQLIDSAPPLRSPGQLQSR